MNPSPRSWAPAYRATPLGRHTLISAGHGAWELLDGEQWAELAGGDPSGELRQQLERKGLVTTPRNGPLIRDARARWATHHGGFPRLFIVELTPDCSLRCGYCGARSTVARQGGAMTWETAEQVVDFAFSGSSPHLCFEFQGGEPLLQFDVMAHLVRYAERRFRGRSGSLEFSVSTNLFQVSDEQLAFFLRHRFALSVSYDGPAPVHDAQRKDRTGKGSHTRVRRNLQRARDMGVEIQPLVVVSRATAGHVTEVLDDLAALGAEEVLFRRVDRRGRALAQWTDVGLTVDEYVDLWWRALCHIDEHMWPAGHRLRERFLSMVLTKLTTGRDVGFPDFRRPCGLATYQLAVSSDGSIYPCDEARGLGEFRLGHVAEDAIDDLLASERVRGLVAASDLPSPTCDACAYRPFCGYCLVVHQESTGEALDDPSDTEECALVRAMFGRVLRLYRDDRPRFDRWVRRYRD